MKNNLFRKIIASGMIASTIMTGCQNSNSKSSTAVSASVVSEQTYGNGEMLTLSEESNVSKEDMSNGYKNFAFDILRLNASANENILLSPTSIIIALDMAAMGANGNTYTQLANVICPEATKYDLNSFALDHIESVKNDDVLKMANSLWLNKDKVEMYNFDINPEYMNFIINNYDAIANTLSFDDQALSMINGWVSEKTDGMIDSIIDEFPDEAYLYLINALAFEGNWEDEYTDYQIHEDGTFTNSQGIQETAKMLSSTEGLYYESDDATGFSKAYEGGRYRFMAILPKDETVALDVFLNDFDGDQFIEFCNSQYSTDVITLTPAFGYDYDIELSQTLQNLGATDAFNSSQADFTTIASAPGMELWIGRVLHKTHIELNESGTKAAAVTAIEMDCEATCAIDEDPIVPKEVILDRPFVYAIMDTEYNVPLFVGTVNTVN